MADVQDTKSIFIIFNVLIEKRKEHTLINELNTHVYIGNVPHGT